MMNLATFGVSTGNHVAGWRHPDAWSNTAMDFEMLKHVAQVAEECKLDAVFVADTLAVNTANKALLEATSSSNRPTTYDPTVLMAALSQYTQSIGLVSTGTTTYDEVYHLARRYASLDHLSGGRAAWNIVTTANPGASLNFGIPDHMVKEGRYQRADEFVSACKALWDTWADDAFRQDKESGVYLDSSRMKIADYAGEHISVRGPLSVSRSPQGYPVLFAAGQSEPGRDLAAKHADCVFAQFTDIAQAREFYEEMKARAAAHGRDPKTLRIMPGFSVFVGETEAAAQKVHDDLNALITPEVGVAYLENHLGTSLGDVDVDGPLPELTFDKEGMSAYRTNIQRLAGQGLTVREIYERVVPSVGSPIILGSGEQVADVMEEWYRTGACDGFVLGVPYHPGMLYNLRDYLIPVLQERGLFRREYEGATLRERMGLPLPANPWDTIPA